MNDRSLLRLCGVLSLLSAACLGGAVALGVSLGGQGPGPINFGDPEVLEALRAAGAKAQLLELLALAGPTLALGAGLGWRALLARDGSYVSLGVLLWLVGMVFVVGQDAAELALVFHLPWIFQGHPESSDALLAMGDMAGELIGTFMLLGDLVSFAGLILIGVALLRRPGVWTLLGGAGVLSALLVCAGLLVPALMLARLAGFALFMVWMAAMGVIMLRARPQAEA